MSNDNDYKSDEKKMEDFSLESILAEYKGSAFINGDKKTPKAKLNEQAEKILKEAAGNMAPESLFKRVSLADTDQPVSRPPEQDPGDTIKIDTSKISQKIAENPSEAAGGASGSGEPLKQDPKKEAVRAFTPKVRPDDGREELRRASARSEVKAPPGAKRGSFSPGKQNGEKDSAVLFFENYRAPETDPETIVADVEKAIEKEMGYAENPNETLASDAPRKMQYGFGDGVYDEGEDWEIAEPDLRDAASTFAVACNSVSLRCVPAAIITLVMVILTLSFEAGLVIPFGIGHSQFGAVGMLLIGLLGVMMLCVDILVRGGVSLIRGTPNAETLVLFSCVFSFITAVFTMLSGAPLILPYCAVSALTLTFAAFGEKFNLRAITDTLKTASSSATPYGVQAEYYEDMDKSVLKKAYSRTDGFYNNLMHPDISELVYRYAAPVLIAASLVLSIITVIFRGGGEHFLHALSAALAAAAPFSLLLTFSVPFGMVAKSIRRSGAALAGWGGADDVCFTDGASVTDEDIFPPGTLSLSGMKLFDGVSPEKAIRFTASLISASGSGLSGLFEEVLKTQGMNKIRVEDFACYEGGVTSLIRGEPVATGSGAFMNLLGVRVPDDTNIKSAVYTAVNNRLVAMFAVEYTPINSVQSALISLHKWRIKVFFAVRDFNSTPLMIEQKFRVPLDNFEFIQTKDSYSISDFNSGKQGRMAAILTREGLGPFAEAVTGGRLLKSAAFVATVVSVASAALGVLIMFYLFWSGSVLSARPGNLMWFMLSMLAAVLIVCGYVRCKK